MEKILRKEWVHTPNIFLSMVYHLRTHSITSSWTSEGQVPCCPQDLQEEAIHPTEFEKWVNRRWKQEWDKGGGKRLWKVWAAPALAEGILEVWEQLWAQARGMSPYLTCEAGGKPIGLMGVEQGHRVTKRWAGNSMRKDTGTKGSKVRWQQMTPGNVILGPGCQELFRGEAQYTQVYCGSLC